MDAIRPYSGKRFCLLTALPAFCIALGTALGVLHLVQWSAQTIDTAAIARQKDLVSVVVERLRTDIAHDQESSTVWDDAVLAMRNPPTPNWIDLNLGSWMYTYFGHEGAYVLDSTDVPIFAAESGETVSLEAFERIRAATLPLLAELRRKLREGDVEGLGDRILSPGASDYAFDGGRPVLISAKPIVSDSGTIEQTPGTEYIHIAVRFLDGAFIDELSQLYLFDDLRFVRTTSVEPGMETYPIRAASGDVIGYYAWRPYRPGTEALETITPVIAGLLVALFLATGGVLLMLHMRRTSARDHAKRLHHISRHDALTGLPNRGEFQRRLDTLLSNPEAAGGAVMLLDLDRFKGFNDARGHAAGDAAIAETARRIARVAENSGAAVFRMEGDEFAVLAPGLADPQPLCTAILAAMHPPMMLDDGPATVSVSIGTARFPLHGAERTELLRKADVALRQAKEDGRGRAAMFNAELGALLLEHAELEQDLRIALRDFRQISVFYQPVYSAADRRLVAAEALARWEHPTRGWVSPATFIPIAEGSNLIKRLGTHVLRVACHAAAAWPIDTIAVNASAIQLRDPGFVDTVCAALVDAKLAPHRLEIEITESAWVAETAQCADNLRALRALGVRVALDDFGTGFSSLGRLHQSPTVDRIKIDQSFVRGTGMVEGDAAIVRAIVDLARAKGIRTTAEGVETPEAADFLAQLGCDELQGYLFARPMPADAADALIHESRTAQSALTG